MGVHLGMVKKRLHALLFSSTKRFSTYLVITFWEDFVVLFLDANNRNVLYLILVSVLIYLFIFGHVLFFFLLP